jgi:ketosteroid isomerase-like protein
MNRFTSISLLVAAGAMLVASGCERQASPLVAVDGDATLSVQGPPPLASGHPVHGDIRDILENQWVAYYNAGDFAGLAGLYTESSWLMPPNAPRFEGRAAIAAYWAALADAFPPGTTPVLRVVEVEHFGHTANVIATWEARAFDGTLLDGGHVLKVFKRDQGEWLIHRSIFNSDHMPPPA